MVNGHEIGSDMTMTESNNYRRTILQIQNARRLAAAAQAVSKRELDAAISRVQKLGGDPDGSHEVRSLRAINARTRSFWRDAARRHQAALEALRQSK